MHWVVHPSCGGSHYSPRVVLTTRFPQTQQIDGPVPVSVQIPCPFPFVSTEVAILQSYVHPSWGGSHCSPVSVSTILLPQPPAEHNILIKNE